MKTSSYSESVGIVGAGQLGLMMILESRNLPLSFNVYGGEKDPAMEIASRKYKGEDWEKFVDQSDTVTYEFEHVDRRILEYANKQGKLFPSIKSVDLKMKRHREKIFLRDNGFPVGEFVVEKNAEKALESSKKFEKFVIKRSEGGYDGKGQFYHNRMDDYPIDEEGEFVVEKFVDYDYEASIIAGRSVDGEKFYYEPSENLNKNGILIRNNTTLKDEKIKEEMRDIASRLMEKLDYYGVIGIEFFVVDDRLLINEYAPRVHNTGHHTLMGSNVSQFQNHIRAITGLPIAHPETYLPSGIVNILGKKLTLKESKSILKLGDTDIYDYRKEEVRRKRKMGHVNVVGRNERELMNKIGEIQRIMYGESLYDYI
ncbi:5-(carboxyamino)imidazole ribonucleotide synthase [Caldiplasma sukawensis]